MHDQGVIHRDIKGSNILATKEGSVKLADFGVATRVGPLKDSSVVGSPYWMAPEVIDQSGATTASDIWSVGAVVIELLSGRPPYAELDPMPALFRIVNDDCPPLPDGSSATARDFLQQCFQKDGNLRISARKLQRHPWMMQARRQLEINKEQQQKRPRSQTHKPQNAYYETVNRVQEWNKAIESAPRCDRVLMCQHRREAHVSFCSSAPAAPTHPRLISRPSENVAHLLQSNKHHPDPIAPAGSHFRKNSNPAHPQQHRGALHNVSVNVPVTSMPLPLPAQTVAPEAEEDNNNWDTDFEGAISIKPKAHGALCAACLIRSGPRLQGSVRIYACATGLDRSEDPGTEEQAQTVRPGKSPLVSSGFPPQASRMDDYSDLVSVEDGGTFAGRVAQMRVRVQLRDLFLNTF